MKFLLIGILLLLSGCSYNEEANDKQVGACIKQSGVPLMQANGFMYDCKFNDNIKSKGE